MKIVYKTGNLLEAEEPAIAHGCNAQGVMGSGVAAFVRSRYPEAYADYRAVYEERGLKVGEVWPVPCAPHWVLNAITQEFFGNAASTGKVYVSYDGIRDAMKFINEMAKIKDFSAVAMPLIGAGLAGGSWKVISAIIEEEATDFRPVVYLLDGNIPTT